MTLRRKLTLIVLALLMLGLTIAPVSTFAVARDFGGDEARRDLNAIALRLEPLLRDGAPLPGGDTRLLAVFGEVLIQLDGVTVTTSQDPPGADWDLESRWSDGRVEFRRLDGDDMHVDWWLRASTLDDGRSLVLGLRTAEYDDLLGRLIGVHIAITTLVLILLAILAYRAVRRAMQPLDEIAVTARAIGEGQLSRRVELKDPRTEPGRLGLALNAMLGQIETAFRERTRSEQRLRRFVADASHELRTPVATIRGYAELFRRGASSRPEDLALAMERIESEATRMGVLVDELLLLARLDQRRALERRPVDLGALAAEAVEAAHAVEPDRPFTLDVADVVVTGDAVRLRQILDNLLANARQHTPPGTPVTVTVAADGVVSVRDEGPGMTEEQRTRAFDRFYRASSGTAGAGLGLAIVAAVAEAHGGRAWIDSAPGRGTTVRVSLPPGPDTPDACR
ncbi:MAG: HAMP domain-containing histidine kinase [Thermoactinospora sp.]|nr:HAMP domain-containing histidine kinase [Thermoactinospora sp.]